MYLRSESLTYLSSSHYSTLVGESEDTVTRISLTTQKKYWGEVSDVTNPFSFPLLHVVYGASNRKDDVIVVGGANNKGVVDYPTCGWDDLPCRSVEYAIDKLPSEHHVTDKSVFTISLLPGTYSSDDWKCGISDNQLEIVRSNQESVILVIDASTTGYVVDSGTLSIQTFTLSVVNGVFLTGNGGDISISDVTVTAASSISTLTSPVTG